MNEGKRLHGDSQKRLFCYDGGLPERKPHTSPDQLPRKPQEPPRNAATKAHYLPTFCPLFSNVSLLSPFLVSENTEETPTHPKEFLIFAPFQPILSRFAPVVRSSGSPAALIRPDTPEVARVLPDSPEMQGTEERQPHHPTTPQG